MPVASVREMLLENAAKLYPKMLNAEGKFDVVRDIVGRRPAREGGLCLEVETLPIRVDGSAPLRLTVVNAFGAGGRGFELSWGIAKEVLKMVKSKLPKPIRSRL